MAWQGVPFSFLSNDALIHAELFLNKIPEIVVKTGFGWDTFLAAIFASGITGAISYYAIRASNKSIKEERERQERLTMKQLKAQFVSSNRQQWVNDLRDTMSTYNSLAISQLNIHVRIYNALKNDKQRTVDSALIDEKRKIQSEMSYCVTKIELLLNPKEQETTEIITYMNDIATHFNSLQNFNRVDPSVANNILVKLNSVTKTVCKNEWEKIKAHS
ncbi:hypothetical protein [uncultured Enterobacter sp.]|uniref:hypothetical protein n=1 Tax=uncultured Enterobacter sp. TaxID=238202 RepID=UPI00266C9702|nr:hypothetical protein [uncultured Enterobacter sp.]